MAANKCPKCYSEIPANPGVCPKCGYPVRENDTIKSGYLTPAAAKPKPADQKIKLRLLILLIISFCLLTVYFVVPEITGHSIGSYLDVLFLKHQLPVVNGNIIVAAHDLRYVNFSTNNKWRNIYLEGTINVSDGGGKDIRILIMKKKDFDKFSTSRKPNIFYNSGKITASKIKVEIPSKAEDYVLIIDNTITTPMIKTVNGQVYLIYSSY